MFSDYFVLLKAFLIVFYFINSLFKRKSVQKLTEVSIKISKISFFYSFKLNEKKNVHKKIRYGEREREREREREGGRERGERQSYTNIFAGRGLICNRGLEIF